MRVKKIFGSILAGVLIVSGVSMSANAADIAPKNFEHRDRVIENLPAHSRDFSRELAGRILSGKISRNADFFCSFCCAYGIIKMVINI